MSKGRRKRLKLDDITIDAETHARGCIDEDTVTDYAECMTEGDKFPPVIVFNDGSRFYLADGFHRVLAAARIGYTEIDAEVKKGTREDALWYAGGAAKTHGLRATREDLLRFNKLEDVLRSNKLEEFLRSNKSLEEFLRSNKSLEGKQI